MTDALRIMALERAVIDAVLHHRFDEAAAALEQLRTGPHPIVAGVCRYCGCSDLRPCGIAVMNTVLDELEPVGCTWMDDNRTVCSNTRYLDRWTRDTTYPPPDRGGDRSSLVTP